MKQAKFICDKRLSHRFLGLKRVANYSLGELFLNPLHGLPDVGDFPIGQTVKNLPAIQQTWVRYLGSIPGSGRSRGGGNGNLLQYSCLKNPMDRGAWRATVQRDARIWTWLSTHAHTAFLYPPPTPHTHLHQSAIWGFSKRHWLERNHGWKLGTKYKCNK